jgi:hypothetical protein
VLPFRIPVKELVDTLPEAGKEYLEIFKRHRIRSNLDVLETFRTPERREQFAAETTLDEATLLQLAHRADLSRLAYVRGKTITHLCGGGYDTLEILAKADILKMEADMTAYYQSMGKTFADFKTVIPLDWMIGGARVLPIIVEIG